MDLHSGRSAVDFKWLAERLRDLDAPESLLKECRAANTAMQVLTVSREHNLPLADKIAEIAQANALKISGKKTRIEVMIFSRFGELVGRSHD